MTNRVKWTPALLLLLTGILASQAQAQHWVVVMGENAVDCEDPLGHWVRLHFADDEQNYIEDRLWFEADEPGENLRVTMLDVEQLRPDWMPGDDVVVQIMHKYPGDGYYAGPQTVTLTINSFDLVTLQITKDGIIQDPDYPDCLDTDEDLITDVSDNCPSTTNAPPYMGYEQADGDGDRVGDACDACPGTVPGVAVDDTGCPDPPIPNDYDNDGDVDTVDYEAFEECASGPGIGYEQGCDDRDRDSDGDVDQSDFGMFQRCYSGADNPGNSQCEQS